MEYEIYSDGELTHWGIKGMRWGVRRYQNKDGSLTPRGQKRYNTEMEKIKSREKVIKNRERTKSKIDSMNAKKAELEEREQKLLGKKTDKDDSTKSKPKTVSEMSNDEVRALTERMRLEKDYHDAKKNLAIANPAKVPAGKKFIDGLMNDVVVPAAKNAGREWLEKTMKDKLGLNEKDPLTRLEKKYKELDWRKKIQDLNRDLDPDRVKLQKAYDKADLEKKIRDANKNEPDIDDIVNKFANMTPEQVRAAQTAATNKYWWEAAKGKGAKPDKDKKNKDKDDDDD